MPAIRDTLAPWTKQTIRDEQGKRPDVTNFKRDADAVLQEILDNPKVKDICVLSPRKVYGEEGVRVYTGIETGHWWWDMQVALKYFKRSTDSRQRFLQIQLLMSPVEQ
jgi:hypothetical protein